MKTFSQPPSTGRKVGRTPTPPSDTYHSFGLEDIRGIKQRHATAGLVPQMFPGARQAMMRKSLDKLDGITEDFVEETSNLSRKNVGQHSREVFLRYEQTPLYLAVMEFTRCKVDEYCQRLLEESMSMCGIERQSLTLSTAQPRSRKRRSGSLIFSTLVQNLVLNSRNRLMTPAKSTNPKRANTRKR